MPPAFSFEEWKTLSSTERIRLCCDFAAEAQRLAAETHPDAREKYLRIAAIWLKLAKDIEQPAGSD